MAVIRFHPPSPSRRGGLVRGRPLRFEFRQANRPHGSAPGSVDSHRRWLQHGAEAGDWPV